MPFRSIRTRILAVFALALAALGGALGYGIVQLRAIGEGVQAIHRGYVPLAGVAADLQAVVRQMDRDMERTARDAPRPRAGHRSNAALASASLDDDVSRGRAVIEGARLELSDPDELRALDSADDLLDQIARASDAFAVASAAWLGEQDPTRATAALVEVDRRRKELTLIISQLSALVEGRIAAVSETTAQAQTRARAVSGALAGLAVLLAGALAAVALVTLRPIGRLTEQVQRLAAGQAAGRVQVASDDEVGVLAREFNAMAEAVAERDRRLSERAAALDRLSLHLRQVLDTMRAGLVVIEERPGGPVVRMANPAATELWGVAEGEPLPAALVPFLPADPATLPQRSEAEAIGGRRFDVDVVPFGPRGALLVGEDVTRRLEDRERLARSERLAVVGQMLAQITHEVRNPLNAMSLNAELLAEDVTDPEARAMLETISGEIHRLEQVTARYLDLSRRRAPEPQAANPLSTVREVVRVEEEALRRAGVDATVTGDDLGLVELDADALRRAVRNLVRNAVEAGARAVSLRVRGEEGRVVVEVQDDGPGMQLDQSRRAFDPFYTTKAQGTGLGLAITRQELEDGGGSLQLQTAEGQGCTFTLMIPTSPAPP